MRPAVACQRINVAPAGTERSVCPLIKTRGGAAERCAPGVREGSGDRRQQAAALALEAKGQEFEADNPGIIVSATRPADAADHRNGAAVLRFQPKPLTNPQLYDRTNAHAVQRQVFGQSAGDDIWSARPPEGDRHPMR